MCIRDSECPQKNFSPFGPAVWPAIGNIYMNVLFYYIENNSNNNNEDNEKNNDNNLIVVLLCMRVVQ